MTQVSLKDSLLLYKPRLRKELTRKKEATSLKVTSMSYENANVSQLKLLVTMM
jgi:hypothetical protein